MNDDSDLPTGQHPDTDELPAIEFQSPGRFAVHNPLPLPAEPEARRPAPSRPAQRAAPERPSHPDAARPPALALLQQVRHSLCLYTPDLEPWLYHHSSVQEACTRFLLANPRNHLRILLRDSSRAVKEGHRLLNLARRVTSNLHIRKLHPDYPSEEAAFLLADDRGLLLRPKPEIPEGYALYNDPGRVRQRQEQFDQAWDQSITDPDLRSFLL